MFHRLLGTASLAAALFVTTLSADELRTAQPVEFEKLHELITPQRGESRWMEVQWYPNIWEARQKAAAEGKPLFLMAGSGGAPAAGC